MRSPVLAVLAALTLTGCGPDAQPPVPDRSPIPPAVHFADCDAARAAGAAPLHHGQPGYRPALDRDHDGVACD